MAQRRRRLSPRAARTGRRIGYGAAVILSGLSLFLAFDRGRDEEPVVQRGAILRVFPEPGAVAVRQDAIGADLAFGYDATIEIDQRTIPDDQLDRVSGINRLSFTPGVGKELTKLTEGRHCAAIRYFPVGKQPEDAAAPFSWCFTSA